jgi:aspartate/methionine/tyrosine aminotransferase
VAKQIWDEANPVASPFWLSKLLVRAGLGRLLPSIRQLTDGGRRFVRYYGDRVLAAPAGELRDFHSLLEIQSPEVIDLSLGASRIDRVPSIGTKLPVDRRGWPPLWGLAELREAIADKLLIENQIGVCPRDEVLVTAGASGAFHTVLDTFVNPGDGVVLFDPASPLYSLALKQRRARVRWVPSWVEDGRLRFLAHHFAQATRGARLVVVNSPANPTGGTFAVQDLEHITWWAQKRDLLLVSDEVFAKFRYDGEAPSLGSLPMALQRTLTLGSVSQEFSLASARVGWLAGNRHLVRVCALTSAVQTPFVPTVSQLLALSALRQARESFAPLRADLAARRDYIMQRLHAMELNPPFPSGGFFFWVPVWQTGRRGTQFAEQLLRDHDVLVMPGDFFGPSGAGYIRLSYAVDEGRLREGLSRLGEFMAGEPPMRIDSPPLRRAA